MLLQTSRTIIALILREMSTIYGRSPGGYIWAILEPIGAISILSFVFSFAFREPSLGTNFALFYATGYLPFMLYMDVTRKVGQSISFSRPLLQYPTIVVLDAIFARFILNTITHILVFFLVMLGIIIGFDLNIILRPEFILLSLMSAALLGLAMGTFNCLMISVFPAWQTLWNILNKPMFIISCIFFIFEIIPTQFQKYLFFNPLVHIVGLMRKGFYSTYNPNYISMLYISGLSLIILLIGILFLTRYEKDILNK